MSQEAFEESTKEEEVVRHKKKGLIGADEDIEIAAAAHHIWLEGEEVLGVDYTMHEFILSSRTGFNLGTILADEHKSISVEEVFKLYYSHLYPFVKKIVDEYRINRENWKIMVQDQSEMLNIQADMITEKKMFQEYLRERPIVAGEYELFKANFVKEMVARDSVQKSDM